MKFNIYILSKKKTESFYIDAIREYEKRLGAYCKIKVKMIKKERELDKILLGTSDGLLYLIEPGNDMLSSEEFAKSISKWEMSGSGAVTFMIEEKGQFRMDTASYGNCRRLSLSTFHMPAGMEAMILSEQIYRAYRILHKQPYHK